jgi:glycosyltransferase involved in cell wall biosynthesis
MVQQQRPDIVVGVTPTFSGAVAAVTASARYRVPFVLLVHDLMGHAADQSGISGGSKVSSFVRSTELAAAQRATRIGIVADGFRSYFSDAGIPDERIVRLRTWTLGQGAINSRDSTRAELRWGSDFVVLHAGNLGHKQDLDNLIDAAELLRSDRSVRVVLAGDGNDRERLERRVHASSVSNVEFLGPQPWGRYEAMLEAADVLVVNQRPSVSDMSLPSKLTSYFAAGLPIVAAVSPSSETAHEIERSGGGVVVNAGEPKALVRAVRELRSSPERRSSLGSQARDYAAKHLTSAAALLEYEAFITGA